MRVFRSLHFIVLLLCFALIHVAFFVFYGVRSFYDSTIYIACADYLRAYGSLEETYYVFYAVPIALIAFCRSFSSEEILPFLLLQIAVSGVATVCLYKASEKIFQSRLAAILSVLTFLLWWDNLHWNSAIMTESIFCSLLCFLIYRLVVFENRRGDWIFVSVILLAIVLTRPTGILISIGVGVFLLCYYWRSLASFFKLVIVGGCIVVAVLGAYAMFSVWDFTDQYNKGNVITYADVAEEKHLKYEGLRIDTDNITLERSQDHPLAKMMRFVFLNPLHFLKAAGMKIGYLLSATRPYYSWQHNVFSLMWLSLVYLLFYFGYRNIRNVPLKFCIVTIILLNCALVGISSVDWDNRFYIPMFPCIALLAGGGGAFLFNRIASLRQR